jgi:hypothetical protein
MRYGFIILCFLFVSACQRKQSAPVAHAIQQDSIVRDTLIQEVKKSEIPLIPEADTREAVEDLHFNYLKAKSRVVWKSGNNQDNYVVDIRMKRDSLIWVNIGQAGFTGATGIFDQQHVRFYQKISGQYFDMSYDSLSTMLGFRVDFRLLQSLIVGNQPFKRNNSRVIRENENIIIKQDSGRVKIDNMVGPNRKLKKLLVNDEPSANKLTLDFEEFTSLNQVVFPFSSLITLDVTSKKDHKQVTTVISIKYSKVELLDTPLEFPFRVPVKLLNSKP